MIINMDKNGNQTHLCEYTRIRDEGSPEPEGPVLLCALQWAGWTDSAQTVEGLLELSLKRPSRSICDRQPGSKQ